MIGNLTGMHLLALVAVLLLLFGATKLPALARSVGQSMRILRNETRSLTAEEKDADAVADAPAANHADTARPAVEPVQRI